MAPTLSSNSFLLNTTPYSRLTPRNQRFTVLTKRAGPIPAFLFGKQTGGLSSEESQGDEKANFNPFLLNFGKAPDMKSLIPVVANRTSGLSFMNLRRKDPSTVFVAGATGQSGARIAQALLREGFTIRAGVADLGAAQELDQLAAQYKVR